MGCCQGSAKSPVQHPDSRQGEEVRKEKTESEVQDTRWNFSKTFNFKRGIEKEWEIFHDNVLGRGAFGIVKRCRRVGDGSDGEICAVKIIRKSKLEEKQDVEDLRVEVDCMRRLGLGSLNCIALYDTFEDEENVYMVMELAEGGELYKRIKKGQYSEAAAAQIARSILQMVAQCHAKHIVYRDIKPTNFLFTSKSESAVLKGTDFGLAAYHPPGSPKLTDITGTPFYIAPEVVRQSYSFEADVWSVGALVYQLLSGYVPFQASTELKGPEAVVDLFRRVLNAPIDFESDPWPNISDMAKDFVSRLLTRDVSKRISVMDALNHPWLKEGAAPASALTDDVVQRLQRYSTYGRFRQQAMVAALAKVKDGDGGLNLPWSGNMDKLTAMFEDMDSDKNGSLSCAEIRDGLRAAGYSLSDAEVQQLFQAVDVDRTGNISLNEFLAAMLDWQQQQEHAAPPLPPSEAHMSHMIWKDLFEKYDIDKSGGIGAEEIAVILGLAPESPEIQDVLREADMDTNGHITFEEFTALMEGSHKDSLEIYSKRRVKVDGD
uniref:Calcium-dependent protein kinase n=1 Tax=Tetraselmis sp. GSL018 TaxID=582737 RepID=A0A061S5H3_9CHLO